MYFTDPKKGVSIVTAELVKQNDVLLCWASVEEPYEAWVLNGATIP
jgi:hypothetical protein